MADRRSRPLPTRGPRPPAGERLRERYEARRDQIVDDAARVFAAKGYHATTIHDLEQATGLQRGGLYHYTSGKLDLLIAIHRRFIEPLLTTATAISKSDDAPDVQLRRLGHALLESIAEYRDQVTVFLHEWRVIESERAWADVRSQRKQFERIVAEVLKRGRKQGLFQFADTRLTVLAFLGMVNYSYQWFDPQGRVPPGRIADRFVDIFLTGIETDNTDRSV